MHLNSIEPCLNVIVLNIQQASKVRNLSGNSGISFFLKKERKMQNKINDTYLFIYICKEKYNCKTLIILNKQTLDQIKGEEVFPP
jgi:hypothetical protein